jgi:large subunit ribosomal protein L25
MATLSLKAESRATIGTGSARAARRNEQVPAVVYGTGQTSLHINLPLKEVTTLAGKRNYKSTIVEIELDGKKVKTLPREIQFHKISDKPTHVDLQFITAKTAVRVFVPVEVINQAKSPGIKRGGVLNLVRREIEFFCNPEAIPQKIEVDLTGREIGASVHINDVKLPDGVRATIKRNFTVATIAGRAAEEEVAATAAPVAAPVVASAQKAPEAAPAAGAAKTPAKDAKKK